MVYFIFNEFVIRMVDVGELKLLMLICDMLICVYMVGVIFVFVVVFVVSIIINIGNVLVGLLLFLVGFCMLYLLGFDLFIGVFMFVLFVVIDCWFGVIWGGVFCNWMFVFFGNFVGVLMVVLFMVIIFIFGFLEVLNVIG